MGTLRRSGICVENVVKYLGSAPEEPYFFVFTGCRVLDALVNGVWKNLVKVWNLDKVECELFVKSQIKRSKSQVQE